MVRGLGLSSKVTPGTGKWHLLDSFCLTASSHLVESICREIETLDKRHVRSLQLV